MKSNSQIFTKPVYPVLIAIIGYICLALFYAILLKYNFFRSDVLGYWQDSLNWQTPYHPFHVPGYPLVIALLRGVTFGIFPPVLSMMAINLLALTLSVYLVYKILSDSGIMNEIAFSGAVLFTLWPLVGLNYTVSPLADVPAMCLFLAGIYYLIHSKRMTAAIFLGIAVIFHKAIWPFVGLVVLAEMVKNREFISKRNVPFWALLLLPVCLLWLFGAMYHQSISWQFSSNLSAEMAYPGKFPLFEGVIGTLFSGGIKGTIKGIILAGFALLTVLSLGLSIKNAGPSKYLAIAISSAVFLLFVFLNQTVIWGAARFSRLLVLPLALGWSSFSTGKNSQKIISCINSPVFVLLLFASQVVFAWYQARVFFA